MADGESVQQLEKSEQDRYDLQRKLKAAEGGEAAAAQKVRPDFTTIPIMTFPTLFPRLTTEFLVIE